MNRQQKQALLEDINQLYTENEYVFLALMNSVTAESAMNFRSDIRKNQGKVKVIKNTLNKIGAQKASFESLSDNFSKQTVTVFTNNPIDTAKTLDEYKDKGYQVIGGSNKTNVFSPEDVKKLATTPPLPVLRSMLLAAMLGVHTKTVRLLSESASSFLRLLMANVNKPNQ